MSNCFLFKCEEIIEADIGYNDINVEILKLEKEIIPLLSKEAMDKFLKIDKLNMKLINHIHEIVNDKFTINR